MYKANRSMPLRADLRREKPPFRFGALSRGARWSTLIGIGVSLPALISLLPGVRLGTALVLAQWWVLAAMFIGCAVVVWRFPGTRWSRRLMLAVVTAWAVARAVYETYVALV